MFYDSSLMIYRSSCRGIEIDSLVTVHFIKMHHLLLIWVHHLSLWKLSIQVLIKDCLHILALSLEPVRIVRCHDLLILHIRIHSVEI